MYCRQRAHRAPCAIRIINSIQSLSLVRYDDHQLDLDWTGVSDLSIEIEEITISQPIFIHIYVFINKHITPMLFVLSSDHVWHEKFHFHVNQAFFYFFFNILIFNAVLTDIIVQKIHCRRRSNSPKNCWFDPLTVKWRTTWELPKS